MTEGFQEIPVLDLAPLVSGGDIASLATEFGRAYSETGFAYVVNHGVDPDLRASVFAAARRFHQLTRPSPAR